MHTGGRFVQNMSVHWCSIWSDKQHIWWDIVLCPTVLHWTVIFIDLQLGVNYKLFITDKQMDRYCKQILATVYEMLDGINGDLINTQRKYKQTDIMPLQSPLLLSM